MGGAGSRGGAGAGSGGGGGSSGGGSSAGSLRVSKASASGLRSGHATLSFTLRAAKGAAKIAAVTIELPAGMSFIPHRAGHKLTVRGLTLTAAKIKSLTLTHGHLVITLRKPVSSLTVKIKAAALKESAALKAKAKAHKLASLRLTVITRNTRAKRSTIHLQIKNLG